jgi:hypothetical protein
VVNLLAVDTDPTGNTATSLGTIQDCVTASSGELVTVDVVVDSVPEPGVQSFAVDVLYDPAILEVTAVDYNQLLVASGGSLFTIVNPLPDRDGDYRFEAADLAGAGAYETGPGVFLRITFRAVGTGVSQIVLSDELSGDFMPNVIYPPAGDKFWIEQLQAGAISVGTNCPSPADLRVDSASVNVPAQATAGESFNLTVDSVVSNAGPNSPVDGDVTTSVQLPPDCSAAGGTSQTHQDLPLMIGQPEPVSATFVVTCTDASFHTVVANVTIAPDDPFTIEPAPANNLASGNATVAVVGEADLVLGTLTPDVPATVYAGMQFAMTASVPITNSGPYGPVTARTGGLLGLPAGCQVYSENRDFDERAVGAGQSSTVTFSWSVVCVNPGTYSFTYSAGTEAVELHIVDPAVAPESTASLSFDVYVGICGPDPAPAGDPIQNMSPELIALIGRLTSDGTEAPEQYRQQISCVMDQTARDVANTPGDDCPVGVLAEQPCSLGIDVTLDLLGGSQPATPSVRLAPIGVTFAPPEIDWAPDTEVPNGTGNSSGKFSIRTDGSLQFFGVPCQVDAEFSPKGGYEAAIQGNAPETNDNALITNANYWSNDLNAERAAVESAFVPAAGLPSGITLWSRSVIPLIDFGTALPLNVLTWKVTNPAYEALTGAGWIIVAFPGDALNPDPAGSIGNPDATDPPAGPHPTVTCAPHNVEVSFTGMAGSTVFLACTAPGTHMTWTLLDPDARSTTGDEGPRSDVMNCGADVDGDGLSQSAETHWGTNPLLVDSDGDGHPDGTDNCRAVSNPAQEDLEGDLAGDICDPDDENDGAADTADNCPVVANPGQENDVHPGTSAGDHCDDPDSDAHMDTTDNCPDATNPGQENGVHPSTPAGDHCDDPDGDAVPDVNDNCADISNPAQQNGVHPGSPAGDHCDDPDDDSVMDNADNCADVPNPAQQNDDGDGFGNACDFCPAFGTAWDVPTTDDADCDGFPDSVAVAGRAREVSIGTDATDRCADTTAPNDETAPGQSPWPPDFNDDRVADLSDISMLSPTYNKSLGQAGYQARKDLNANNVVDLSDISLMSPFYNRSCTP